MLKAIKYSLIATIPSGIVSGFAMTYGADYIGPSSLFYATGIIFGIATALLFRKLFKQNYPKSILWIFASTFSWRIAVLVFMSVGGGTAVSQVSGNFLNSATTQFMLAGAAGSAMLAVLFWVIIYRSSVKSMVITVVTGAVLGLVMNLIFKIGDSPAYFFLAFTVWQSGVALSFTTQNKLASSS